MTVSPDNQLSAQRIPSVSIQNDDARTPIPPPPAPPPPPPVPRHPLQQKFDRVLVVGFLLMIALPLMGTMMHWDRAAPLNENRALAAWPRVPHGFREATRLSDNLLAYFSDHFGFRNELIYTTHTLLFRTMGLAHTRSVAVGRDGWLFMHPVGDDWSFNAENGLLPFTEAELNEWQALLERRQAYLTSRGVPLVLVIAPDKGTIYPEKLPIDPARRSVSRLDQLIARLEARRSPVKIVDLRAALLAEKAQRELYLRLDTHWNDDGSWVGYQQIMAAVKKALPGFTMTMQTREDFTVQEEGQKSGDLVGLLALDGEMTEHRFWLLHKPPFQFQRDRVEGIEMHTVDLPDAPGATVRPRLLMFRDSFATALFQMIPPHFSHSLWVWNNDMDEAIIVREEPDIVIDEFVERNLYGPVPHDSAGIRAMASQ